jgi:hemerythrin-like domain-containing protein
MAFTLQVPQALDVEHRASLDLIVRLEGALAGGREADLSAVAGPLVRELEQQVGRHFDFEEGELFPRMAEAGDGELAALLTEEHEAIREVSAELLPLARACAGGSLPGAGQLAFKRLGLEWIERMVSHIQKETMGLLPLLDDLLDPDADRELAFAYAAG